MDSFRDWKRKRDPPNSTIYLSACLCVCLSTCFIPKIKIKFGSSSCQSLSSCSLLHLKIHLTILPEHIYFLVSLVLRIRILPEHIYFLASLVLRIRILPEHIYFLASLVLRIRIRKILASSMRIRGSAKICRYIGQNINQKIQLKTVLLSTKSELLIKRR